MATIDAAGTFYEYANHLVASEEVEPGCGWEYEDFSPRLPKIPG
ncbi:MAG: hypothetical protein LBD02_02820 [Christensenellaceae bacterium]|jgi:hypothetical protein|nr:hypothetical protein [Christensenellaceae bacterium]